MIATADSNVISSIWTIIRILRIDDGIIGPVFPKSVSSKCPAIMLAASRTARVPGRITFLIVSIHTIKGISAGGVP